MVANTCRWTNFFRNFKQRKMKVRKQIRRQRCTLLICKQNLANENVVYRCSCRNGTHGKKTTYFIVQKLLNLIGFLWVFFWFESELFLNWARCFQEWEEEKIVRRTTGSKESYFYLVSNMSLTSLQKVPNLSLRSPY